MCIIDICTSFVEIQTSPFDLKYLIFLWVHFPVGPWSRNLKCWYDRHTTWDQYSHISTRLEEPNRLPFVTNSMHKSKAQRFNWYNPLRIIRFVPTWCQCSITIVYSLFHNYSSDLKFFVFCFFILGQTHGTRKNDWHPMHNSDFLFSTFVHGYITFESNYTNKPVKLHFVRIIW